MTQICIFLCLATAISLHAHPGVGIVEDSKGNVFYTDLKQVWKIDRAGKKSVAVPNVHTHELYIDSLDNLFGEHLWYNGEAANTWGHFVWRLASDGKVTKVIPDTKGFLENFSFVRDHLGRMYWADRSDACQKVERKNLDNSVVQLGTHCFTNIRWIMSTKDGMVYLVDFQDLKKLDNRGVVKTIAANIAESKLTQFQVSDDHAVFGIWDDPAGNIYTALYSGRMVKKFAANGKEEIVMKTSFPWSPTGGFVSRQSELWVLEASVTNAVRVERLMKDGRRIIY